MIRVLIADDHSLMREGIRSLLGLAGDIQVVGTAENGQRAFDQALTLEPDVVVMDVSMPIMNGLESTLLIRGRNGSIHILMIAMSSEAALIRKALENGANGFVDKQELAGELVPGIRTVHQGDRYFSHLASLSLAMSPVDPWQKGDTELSTENS